MITNWGLFNYHETSNTLVILFSSLKEDHRENHGDVDLLFSNNTLIGYSIKDFNRIAKIKYSGIIFLPHDFLVDAINSLLKNNGLETLSYKHHSGYIVKTINGKRVCYALEGTFLRDESISKGHICTFHDLFIENDNPNEILEVYDDIKDDTDFFQMEAK